jgi:hypothetical protein
MGLFDETLVRYQGTFYRQFSQWEEMPDLKYYFGDETVAERGVCAGSCMDWLEHYLTAPRGVRYSNALMSRNRQKIVTIQRALRFRDQSLIELCVLYGLETRTGYPIDDVVDAGNRDAVVALIAGTAGVDVISYDDPDQGRHAVACYVRTGDRMMYFIDVHRGDVEVPYPHSVAWLTRYFGLFITKCGSLRVTHFRGVWNPAQANQAYRAVIRDSLRYNPRRFGIVPQHRARDDAHDVVGFRQRGRLDGL